MASDSPDRPTNLKICTIPLYETHLCTNPIQHFCKKSRLCQAYNVQFVVWIYLYDNNKKMNKKMDISITSTGNIEFGQGC